MAASGAGATEDSSIALAAEADFAERDSPLAAGIFTTFLVVR
jgi:hypothetical protein